jgi:Putative beta-barrel porin-2, OmpL-like. bbp2
MRVLNGCKSLFAWMLFTILFFAVPGASRADDDKKDDAGSAKPVVQMDGPSKPAAGLTEREQWLLERVEQLEKRVAELEAGQSKSSDKSASLGSAASTPSDPASAPSVTPASASTSSSDVVLSPAPSGNVGPNSSSTSQKAAAEVPKTEPAQPFAYADWTWLNGNARTKDLVWDSKYFTPEFRVDTNYIQNYNQPKDHTMGGSTEAFRNGEVQLEQLSFGGDLHVGNVRGRILTMFGLFATTTPRNDASAGVGQWNLNDAYRYFSEAWGGYHFNVNHGLNIDAGIFVSYIGLFSYYNFDNWAYQPSFVSSNTPWFFNGVRIQWFPTDKLKIEPWIINGWQSYAKYNGHPGLGGQILWRPQPWLSVVSNNYGMGTDTLGVPGRSRIHTDDSIEVRYFNQPENSGLDKMAFSLTGDLGCEYGGSAPGTVVSCHNNSNGHPKQSFAGWMLYNRWWFNRDKYAFTLGGGKMDNPGRYLTLLPPINGATAVSGSPYFPGVPGSIYKAWDSTATFDYMPSQYITFRFETGYRHANVPYWSGRQGITPPGGNVAPVANNGVVGTGASYICTNGSTSAVSSFSPTGNGFAADNAGGAVTASCVTTYGSSWSAWQPDLRRGQAVNIIAIMVKF